MFNRNWYQSTSSNSENANGQNCVWQYWPGGGSLPCGACLGTLWFVLSTTQSLETHLDPETLDILLVFTIALLSFKW